MNQLKLIYALISLMILTLPDAQSQVSLDWSRSNDPLVNNGQSAYDIAVGAGGDHYVLGYHERGYNGVDVALVKYSPSGELRWAKSFDGGNENNSDLGRSLALVRSGSNVFIYAACEISISGYGNQAGLLKYDSSGNMLWSKTIASGLNSKVTKAAADASGNIFLAGGSSAEPFVIKFNSSGDTLWMRKIPSAGYTNGIVNDIKLDSLGNVFGTGKITGSGSFYDDIITFKINSSGALQWSKTYHAFSSEEGSAAVLYQGYFYITGYSNSTNGYADIFTIKYNGATGDTMWIKRFNGSSNFQDNGFDIAADSNGDVYVTGRTDGAVYSGDIVTIKYNSAGTQVWTKKYIGSLGAEDLGRSVIIDNSGGVYIGGQLSSGNFAQFICIKYNQDGDSLWTRLYETGNKEQMNAMALDSSGNILLAGECDYMDMVTLKYNSSGNLSWIKKFYGAELISDFANCIAVDKNGNVYCAGKTRVIQYGDQFTVLKYNRTGTLLWTRSYGVQLYDNYDEAKAIAIDNAGFIYVTGTSHSRFNNQTKDFLTFKLDTAGNQYWYATFHGSGNGHDDAKAIAYDNSGNVYVAGESRSASLTIDYCVVKYNSAGTKIWERYYNGPSNGGDYAYDVTADNSGNVYLTGQSGGGSTGDDIATVKYNSSGTQQWVQRFNGSANGADIGNTIEVDHTGNVYVCGMAKENATGYNSILLKYNSSGNLRWSKQDSNNDSLNSIETAASIKLDSSKTRIYLAGHWTSPLAEGRSAHFLAKYDSSGYRIFRSDALFYYSVSSRTYVTGLALDKNQNVYISANVDYGNSNPPEIVLNAYDSSMYPYYSIRPGIENSISGPDGKDLIAVSDNGDIFLGGGIYDSTAGRLMSVIKYKQKPFELTLKAYIQGFYNASANTMIPDTIRAYIRYPTLPYNVFDSAIAVLNSNGEAVLKFTKKLSMVDDQAYMLNIKHRNSIDTWVSTFIYFSYGALTYDFYSTAAAAYESNQIQVDASPVRFAIYNGDVNRDGAVDLTDVTTVYNSSISFTSGYVLSDLTGDNAVDLTDVTLAYNNSNLFVTAHIP